MYVAICVEVMCLLVRLGYETIKFKLWYKMQIKIVFAPSTQRSQHVRYLPLYATLFATI